MVNNIYVWKTSQYGNYMQYKLPLITQQETPDFITDGILLYDKVKMLKYNGKFYEIYCAIKQCKQIIDINDEEVYDVFVFELVYDSERNIFTTCDN